MVEGKMRYVFPHHEKVNSVSLSKDGRFALTGSNDWHASLWDLKLDANAKTLISESSTGIGQRWAIK